MNALTAAGHQLGRTAARLALFTKPSLRCVSPSAPKHSCIRFRSARICTSATASQARAAAFPTPTRDSIKAAHDTFYAPEGVQFHNLTLHQGVVHALLQAGFERPSTVQVGPESTRLCKHLS